MIQQNFPISRKKKKQIALFENTAEETSFEW